MNLVGAIVRFRFRIERERNHLVRESDIRSALLERGARLVHSVQPELIGGQRARVEGLDETLDSRAAFAAYVDHLGLEADQAGRVHELATPYLREAP